MPITKRSPGRSKRGEDGLTDLERKFALLYLRDFNATRAYRDAAAPRKISDKTAEANGYRLLQKPSIRDTVKAHRDAQMAEADLSVAQVLEKLRQFLMYDARKVFDESGGVLPMDQWPDDVAAAVVGVKDTMFGREVKFVDKATILEKAMKYHGLFERDNKQKAEAFEEVIFSVVSAKARK